MLREFFLKGAVRPFGSQERTCQGVIAWGGLLVIVAHACVHGWVKFAVNRWYRDFYNLLEVAGELSGNASTTEQDWEAQQAAVMSELMVFVRIATVSVVVMPIAKFFRSVWALQWRLALMRAYVSLWNSNRSPIEGASQRVHEDSYRFGRGIELCLTTVLDSVITLGVFIPVLTELGGATPCPDSLHWLEGMGSSWLVGLAVSSASIGFLVTMILGHTLVQLEVDNQVVEAKLRRDLVILETAPGQICHVRHIPADEPVDADALDEVQSPCFMPPFPHFVPLFTGIQRNYNRLFLNFGVLNLWLAVFDQFNVILPYLVFGPLLFAADPQRRILLGTLVQVSNSFDKVFGSLSIVAENWGGGAPTERLPTSSHSL